MAGGVQTQPPPPHELMVLPSIKPSQLQSKPSLSQVFGQLHTFKAPSTVISEAQPLEDGEIPPLLSSCVPSSSGPQPYKPSLPLSYSNIVQGHKNVLPISEVISIDPAAMCQDSCSLKPLSLFEGKPCVKFKSSEKKILISNQKFVLVGKFSHGRPPLAAIKVFFAALKLQGRYNLSIFDNKHLFIELDLKIDYVMVWLKLTWTISGYAMRIFKWESDFSPVKESAIAPVWIRIEGVPLYLFDKMSLLSIANAIGHPLSVHPLNVSRVKLNSAIICVELNVNTIPMDSIYVCFEDDCSLRPVEGFWLKVYYDVLPPYCNSCLHIGHLVDACKKGPSESGVVSSSVPLDEQIRTATKVFDVLPQRNFPTVSARSSSSFTAGASNNHGRKVKYTQVWRENKDTGVLRPRRPVLNSNDNDLLTENSFGALELTDPDIAVVPSVLVSVDSSIVAMSDSGKDQLPSLSVIQEGLIQDKSSTPTIPGEVILGSSQLERSRLFLQVVGSDSEYVEGRVDSVSPAPVSAIGKEQALPAPDSAVKPIKTDCIFSVHLDKVAVVAEIPAGANQQILSSVAEQVAFPSGPTEHVNEKNQNVTADGLFASTPSSDSSVVMSQNIAVCSKQPPQFTQVSEVIPADVTSYEQIGGLAPVNSMTQVSILTSPTPSKSWANMIEEEEQEDKKIAQLKAPTIEKPSSQLVKLVDELETIKDLNTADNKAYRADTKRYISKDDSQVDEFSFSQGNPRTDLPPAFGKYFISPDGIQIEVNECKEAGYRLIARRSLSPPGRSSPKLISLRQKVTCDQNTLVQDFKGYSAEFLAEVERARSSKNSSPRDKLPTPNGPGQSRQRRNRGRNRYSYGTPDQPPRYRGKGYH